MIHKYLHAGPDAVNVQQVEPVVDEHVGVLQGVPKLNHDQHKWGLEKNWEKGKLSGEKERK